MSGEVSTIQSLKAVDAWIDVINANINGGVRTAFKSSRLKFGGSGANVASSGSSTGLPLQFPESSLTTVNTVVDFTQGAITASTENTHLAIQGEGVFLLISPDAVDTTAGATFGCLKPSANAKILCTRDGEFHTDASGLLVHSSGYYLITWWASNVAGHSVPVYANNPAYTGLNSGTRCVFNNMDIPTVPAGMGAAKLTDFVTGLSPITAQGSTASIPQFIGGKQSLKYSQLGSTVWDFGWVTLSTGPSPCDPNTTMVSQYNAPILTKSLEASNSSMTQSVPELSLAQKLFSALTKVLQTKQTNVDGVLNLVR